MKSKKEKVLPEMSRIESDYLAGEPFKVKANRTKEVSARDHSERKKEASKPLYLTRYE